MTDEYNVINNENIDILYRLILLESIAGYDTSHTRQFNVACTRIQIHTRTFLRNKHRPNLVRSFKIWKNYKSENNEINWNKVFKKICSLMDTCLQKEDKTKIFVS